MNTHKPGLDVLSIGHGDIKIEFDKTKPMEVERAKRIIADMLRRGYALFVHGEGVALHRVKRFDEKHGVYFIADGPAVAAQPEERRGPGRPRLKGIPMAGAKATVVGRSAGG